MSSLVTAAHFATLRIDRRMAALQDKAGPEFAGKSAAVVLAAYRSNLIDDAKTFLRLAIAALEEYPAVVLEDLASPKVGIIRECVFPPSIAEMVRWCDKRLSSRMNEDGSFRDDAEFQEFWKAYRADEPWALELARKMRGGMK